MPISPPIHRPKGYKPKEKWQRSNKNEGKTTTQRGYGAKWRKIRKVVIARDMGLCQRCIRSGTVKAFDAVDHKVPKARGGTDQLDNLECICNPCHTDKTNNEDKGVGGVKSPQPS